MKSIQIIFITFFIITILSVSATCQDKKIGDLYTKNVITFYGQNGFMRNNQRLVFNEVKPLLKSFPASGLEYKQYHKNRTLSFAFFIPAVVSGVLYFTKRDNNNYNTYPAGYGIASIGFLVTTSVFDQQAKKHLQRSVYLYNRDILIQKYKE